MSDNPFSEPEDNDRTIIRPIPGGRRPPSAQPLSGQSSSGQPASGPSLSDTRIGGPAPARPPAAAAVASARMAEGTEDITIGADPLSAAAAPLLQLMARLRNTANAPDSGDLRERTVRQVRAFEQQARDNGVPLEQLRPAHYALCASLDDVVLNTPWGSAGRWGERSLVSTFHQEVRSGERFFDLLRQMSDNPGKFLPVIKLMYLCMSLGFIGQYRLSRRGGGEIERVREETYALIARQQAAANPELAPHTKGVDAPYRPARVRVPLWVVATAGVGLVAGLFLWFSTSLNAASDTTFARLLAAPPAQMPAITRAPIVVAATPVAAPAPAPEPPPPPEPTVLDRLRQFLAPEIAQGLVEVTGTVMQPLVRINGRGMFASGSAKVLPDFFPLLKRIGLALKEEPGMVRVIGYTDNQPIHTIAFPSNFQLSTARAKAASELIAPAVGDATRLASEGRADADPIAPNTTPEGREKNRRIEIVLNRQGL
jgi:type VI secretion system protein ImpK